MYLGSGVNGRNEISAAEKMITTNLIRKDIGEHGSALAYADSVGRHGRGHGVVAANADSKDNTPDRWEQTSDI